MSENAPDAEKVEQVDLSKVPIQLNVTLEDSFRNHCDWEGSHLAEAALTEAARVFRESGRLKRLEELIERIKQVWCKATACRGTANSYRRSAKEALADLAHPDEVHRLRQAADDEERQASLWDEQAAQLERPIAEEKKAILEDLQKALRQAANEFGREYASRGNKIRREELQRFLPRYAESIRLTRISIGATWKLIQEHIGFFAQRLPEAKKAEPDKPQPLIGSVEMPAGPKI